MSCQDLISNDDIKSIYSSHVDEVNFFTPPACEGNDKKKCSIILKKNATVIVEDPIEIEYLRNVSLRSRHEEGKVAVNKLIKLKVAYKGKGLAKAFHSNELTTYRSNLFDEIQLNAAWEGLVVWKKVGFKYYDPKKYDPMIYLLWSRFFFSSFLLSSTDKIKVMDKYKKYSLVPDKYLRGFGAWLESNRINFAFPMYKVIPQGGDND